jgi:uncharacterized membrane protein
MDIFTYNIQWMGFNLYLAILPVIFSWFILKTTHKTLRFTVGILWLLYLPNTIYVFSDLHHLIEQWSMVDVFGKSILVLQYTILEIVGLTCFLIAFQPLERILKKTSYLIVANFLMGFAIVLGKFERVNSWDVFVNPFQVVNSTIQILISPNMLGLIILFGLFSNFFYFLFRNIAKFKFGRFFYAQ